MNAPAQASQHVLMVGFGGPAPGCCKRFDPCPGEAYCFVSGIFGHNEARIDRIKEVAEHYKHFGGFSRFNEETDKQAAALEKELQKRGHQISVTTGYHHWAPYVRDSVQDLKDNGVPNFLVLIMSPHQCSVSWDGYLRIVGEGVTEAGEGAPQAVGVIDPWWNEPGFIEAIADRMRDAAKGEGVDLQSSDVGLLFSAHAIPESVSRTAPYCAQIEETAKLVAENLGVEQFVIGYQSQPSDSRIPWTGPSVEAAIDSLQERGAKTVVAAAIGFLCDNVEVLFDLGVEGSEYAEEKGLKFVRAESVHDHPAFIGMLADRVEAKLSSP